MCFWLYIVFYHVNEYYLYSQLYYYSILRGKQSVFKSIFLPKTTTNIDDYDNVDDGYKQK